MSFILCRPTNLADPRLGAAVVHATDDFFADKARLIDPADPVFIPGKYDDNGKWMDGWESRRKRTAGHDAAVVKLARPAIIEDVEIDTSHFTGNFPPAASLEACRSDAEVPPDDVVWTALTTTLALKGDDRRRITVNDPGVYSHIRLNIYPDGGVARLRVFGRMRAPLTPFEGGALIDLLAAENGGQGIVCNDEHFGKLGNIIMPGRGVNMGDGWETRRRREPGHDWAVLELGQPGVIEQVVLDTAHFKGNFPDRCVLQAAPDGPGDPFALAKASVDWPVLLAEKKLEMDHIHTFDADAKDLGLVRFVRLNIIPDGGVSRLRLLGRPA